MRRAAVICISFLLLLTISPSYSSNDIELIDNAILSQNSTMERNWTANIVVVGYEESLIDELLLLEGLPTIRNYYADEVDITYNIDYEIAYADAAYVDDLRQEMLYNSINGTETGTWLDETALIYQQNNPDEPQRIFYPRDGRVIDGYAIEDWLEENPFITPPDLGYTLYLMNFSEFDAADHSLEHWYDYHAIDPDTGEKQDWFRLEWDNALNPNVTMDYPFFGGRYNTFVVDPTAHQWYLRWTRIWWSADIFTEYDFWTQDLEDKVGSLNLAIPADVDALNVYLRECIWDPITHLFFPYQHQPASYVESGTLKALVFAMDVGTGTSVESLEWVTDAGMQKAHLEELYPFIPWTVDVEYLDIRNEPDWESLFWTYASIDPNGTTIADGYDMFYAIRSLMRPSYVADDDNINVFGVVFIKKQLEMHTDNGRYTGLGGGGQTVIWKSWERYYRPDGITPKDGISSIQLHETMHAIGFHHTWQDEHYSGDFSYGPMGYFAFHNGTSTFDKNWVQGTYLDQMEAVLWNDFVDVQAEFGENERPVTLLAEQRALVSFESARAFYNEMNWLEAYNSLSEARDWVTRMTYSMLDDTPPVIHDWGTIPDEDRSDGFLYWVTMSDNFAGIENVTLFVEVDEYFLWEYRCSSDNGNWTTSVPPFGQTSNITMWVVAWDWGMNVVEGGYISDYTKPPPISDAILITITVGAFSAIGVFVLGSFLMKRKGKSQIT
jgi:hypothetical protein